MKRIVSLTLAFLMLTSLNLVSVSATETAANPVTARYYLDEHIPAGTTITSDTAVNDVSGLAAAGTGWSGPWSNYINGSAVATNNSEIKVGGIDDSTGLYFGFDSSISNYYRMLQSPISTTEDGVYYARATMANARSTAHTDDVVSAFFALGSSSTASDAVKVGMEFFVGDSKQTGTVNDISTSASLDPATAYDILVKLAVDADGTDKVSVEFVKKDSGFTGNWNYETELELGTNPLDFVHFTAQRFGILYFKNIEIESYNATTTLLDEVQAVEEIVASANASNYLNCIERVQELLPDGKHKNAIIAELMKNATEAEANPVTARYYLDEYIPAGTTITSDTAVNDVSGLAAAGTGWSDAWGNSDTEYVALPDSRQVKPYQNELYFGANAAGGYYRHMTNSISTTEDGVYYVSFTMANSQSPAHESSTVSAYFGLGGSQLSSNRDVIIVGMESFPNDTSHAATVNGVDTGIDLDMDTPYDILIKLAVDADGDDKVSVEFVKKGNDFTGTWDYETTVNLRSKPLDFIHFWPQTYGKFFFKDIEVESYNATTTLLDEVEQAATIVASATASNYLDCINQVEELLPDGKHKNAIIAELMSQHADTFAVEDFCFVDADDTTIHFVTDTESDIGVKATVQNFYEVPKNVSLYIAIYNGDTLFGIASDNKTIAAGKKASFSAMLTQDDLPADFSDGDYRIKAFLFDEDLVPLTSFNELELGLVHVSSSALGDGDGSVANPYTLAEAIENAKVLTTEGKKLPVYELTGGEYTVDSTISISNFSFGMEDNPFTLRAAENADVSFIGGEFIPIDDFGPVTDTAVLDRLHPDAVNEIVRVDLNDYGITDYGTLSPYGNLVSIYRLSLYKYTDPYETFTQNEIFFGGERMIAARWPNNAEAEVGEVISEGTVMENWRDDNDVLPDGWVPPEDRNVNEVEGPTFTVTDASEEAPWQRWSQAEDIMLYGRLCYEWADEGMPVSVSSTGVITSDYPVAYGVKEGANFYLWNILEELDAPGEWYLDREGALYFYPTEANDDALIISTLQAPIFSIHNAENIRFEGFTVEGGKKHGISITESKNVTLDGLTIRNMTQNGVHSEGLTDCKILNCEIYGCGENGVTLDGGNQTTLERGNNLISNCHIYSNAELIETYSPAIRLTGCGNTASHNEIHDMPHAGIIFNGSYNIVEYNELYDVVNNSNDMGAIYSYRSRTGIGCVVRHNYIHDLVPIESDLVVNAVQPGVYLDGGRSFVTVESNLFENIGSLKGSMAILQSGRANSIKNNIFINVRQVMFTSPGLWGNDVTETQLSNTGLSLTGMEYLSESPYSEVPHLSNIMTDDPLATKYVVYDDNVLVDGSLFWREFWWRDDSSPAGEEKTLEDWIAINGATFEYAHQIDDLAGAGFVDAANGDYRLNANSPIYTQFPNFIPIDFSNVGRK